MQYKINMKYEYFNKNKNIGSFGQYYFRGNTIEEIKQYKYCSASKNNKSESFNIELTNNDLLLIDLFANHIGLKRSEILSFHLSRFVEELFDKTTDYRDQEYLAETVDNKLSQSGSHHQYESNTWRIKLAFDEGYRRNKMHYEYHPEDLGESLIDIFEKNQDKD